MYRDNTHRRLHGHRSSGFTLIEILIAVVVLSLGLLATAALQIQSTRGSLEATQLTQATMIINDVIDRMRTNPERIDVYATGDLGGGTVEAPVASCTTTTPVEQCFSLRVQQDRWELEQLLEKLSILPDARLCIEHDASAPGNVSVVVAWRGSSETARTDMDSFDACGKPNIDNINFLKQVVVNTYISPANPY
jgi:type IV pilus assembly protein PilV